MKVIDTFAGAGGFSLGFEMAGCTIVGAIEIDKWAYETFEYNHPNAKVVCADMIKLSNQSILKIFGEDSPDIVLGGPPCQGFSICNKNNSDPKDPRNSLFKEFLRVGKVLNPKVMIMENVPNLLKAKTTHNEKVIDIICFELENMGFFVDYDILEATDYGIPQIRKRLFVIASKKRLDSPFPKTTHTVDTVKNDLFSNRLKPCPTLWDAISDLPDIEARQGSEEQPYTMAAKTEYQKMLRNGNTTLYNHKAMNHSKRVVERFASMSYGDSISDVPEHLKPYKRNSKEIAKKIYDQNNRRMPPNKPCHTIPASFYANFVHPFKNRNFTAREGARIQSFPDHFVFKGKPTVISHKLLAREGRINEKYLCQYNQIGNAVPPLLANAIAENILRQIGH
jgi:DNA (cytosine-5)-methyltransferase 1